MWIQLPTTTTCWTTGLMLIILQLSTAALDDDDNDNYDDFTFDDESVVGLDDYSGSAVKADDLP